MLCEVQDPNVQEMVKYVYSQNSERQKNAEQENTALQVKSHLLESFDPRFGWFDRR